MTRYQSPKGFYLEEFSMTNEGRDELLRRILPVIEKHKNLPKAPLTKADIEVLEMAVRDTFPYEAKKTFEAMKGGAGHRPIIMRNLPVLPFNAYMRAEDPHYKEFTSYYIAQGIYALMNTVSNYGNVYLRNTVSRSRPTGNEPHADVWRFSALSAHNFENADTGFVDWRTALAELQREGKKSHIEGDMGSKRLSLEEFAKIDPKITSMTGFSVQVPEMIRGFNELTKDHGIREAIGPDTLVVWDNHAIIHRAYNGSYRKLPEYTYSRAAMFTSANPR